MLRHLRATVTARHSAGSWSLQPESVIRSYALAMMIITKMSRVWDGPGSANGPNSTRSNKCWYPRSGGSNLLNKCGVPPSHYFFPEINHPARGQGGPLRLTRSFVRTTVTAQPEEDDEGKKIVAEAR